MIKKIILFLFMICLTINCNSQENKYNILCQSADSAFRTTNRQFDNKLKKYHSENNQLMNELKTFNEIDSIIDSTKTYQKYITTKFMLRLYWNGYLNGSINSLTKNKVDLINLKKEIIENKKSIESMQRIINRLIKQQNKYE